MTPVDFARNLAESDSPRVRATGVAIIARGLSDDDGLRQGWPMSASLPAAARFLGLDPTAELLAEAAELAPTLSDAVLNRRRQS